MELTLWNSPRPYSWPSPFPRLHKLNDLPNCLKFTTSSLYANDTQIFTSSFNISVLTNNINSKQDSSQEFEPGLDLGFEPGFEPGLDPGLGARTRPRTGQSFAFPPFSTPASHMTYKKRPWLSSWKVSSLMLFYLFLLSFCLWRTRSFFFERNTT